MRLAGCVDRVEGLDPLRPVLSGVLLNRGVTHPSKRCVINGCFAPRVPAAARLGVLFPGELKTSRGIRLAGLFHAGSNDPLEVFLFRHHDLLRFIALSEAPQQRRRGDEGSSYRSGSMPPFASRGPSLGEDRRGWARIAASLNLTRGLDSRKRRRPVVSKLQGRLIDKEES